MSKEEEGSGVLEALMLIYLGAGVITIAIVVWPLAAAIVAVLAAHKVTLSVGVVSRFLMYKSQGMSTEAALKKSGNLWSCSHINWRPVSLGGEHV